MGKRELVALLGLSCWCLVTVVWLFLAVCLGLSAVCYCGISWPRGYKAWVQSRTQNKAQWLAACGHFILSLRMNSSFIISRPDHTIFCIKMWMKTCFHEFTFLCKFSCICNSAIFVRIFMKFSPKCRKSKKLGMIYTILVSLCSFFNWIGPNIKGCI